MSLFSDLEKQTIPLFTEATPGVPVQFFLRCTGCGVAAVAEYMPGLFVSVPPGWWLCDQGNTCLCRSCAIERSKESCK